MADVSSEMRDRVGNLVREKLVEIECLFAEYGMTGDPLVTCVVRDGHNDSFRLILSNDNVCDVSAILLEHAEIMDPAKRMP